VSVTSGAGLDRTLRITAGVLGIVVAVPSFLAFLFVVLFVWLGSEDIPIWLAVPLGVLAIVQLYLAIRTLSARLATAVTVGLLGVLELVVGLFLLVASPTLLPATVVAIVVMFVAGVVALTAAVRMHLRGPAAPPPPQAPAQIRIGRTRPTSSDAPHPMQNGAPAKPSSTPSGAPKSGTARPGAKKSGRRR
jgi:hypothetical protein